jgi:hypothetical protein
MSRRQILDSLRYISTLHYPCGEHFTSALSSAAVSEVNEATGICFLKRDVISDPQHEVGVDVQGEGAHGSSSRLSAKALVNSWWRKPRRTQKGRNDEGDSMLSASRSESDAENRRDGSPCPLRQEPESRYSGEDEKQENVERHLTYLAHPSWCNHEHIRTYPGAFTPLPSYEMGVD